MVMRIDCPFCGPRDVREFRCGGEADRLRPDSPSEVDNAAWARYLYQRDNTKGVYRERWLHYFGCEQWLNVRRDTVSDAIIDVAPVSTEASFPSDQRS